MRNNTLPLRFWDKGQGLGVSVRGMQGDDGQNAFHEELQKLMGVDDHTYALQLLKSGADALQPLCGEVDSLNTIIGAAHDLNPLDGTEARLAIQSAALFAHGMRCLRRSEMQELMCHSEFYLNKAIKLLRLHNETIAALEKRRRGGEQKVTVTHALIAGQAIVNNFSGKGDQHKNGGGSPCSASNAEPKHEQTDITLADSPPWPMDAVDSTEGKAPAQKLQEGDTGARELQPHTASTPQSKLPKGGMSDS